MQPEAQDLDESADTSGARLSGDPDALADALETIQASSERRPYEYAGLTLGIILASIGVVRILVWPGAFHS